MKDIRNLDNILVYLQTPQKTHHMCTYTMTGTTQQNGVAERHNWGLDVMVRNMMSKFWLPKSLWMCALKTTTYLWNRVLTKAIQKDSF